MGSVYSAIQPVIGKRVAIKVLAQHIASNPELVRRFVDEARAVNKIGHPNIVDIFSFGWLPDKRHYFAMEFLDGQSLADRLKRGAFQPDEARRLLRQICQALEAAHRQGIVHRDLKPDNIWIVQPQHGDSYAKLLDFGIAKLVGDADEGQRTQTGIVMGTPAYMSPEQCRGVNVGLGTDIYALGMILYEMFAGRLPFQGSFAELITHHLMTVPEPPSRYRPVPRALDQLILRCVDKDPAQRPQSAEELARSLEAALSSTGDDLKTAAVVAAVQAAPVPAAPSPAPAPAQPDPPMDTFSPPPGRTASDLTIQPARSRRPLLLAGGAAVATVVVAAVLLGGRHGGGDKGSLVLVVDAQAPPATTVPAKPVPGAPTWSSKGSTSRACWSTASWWRRACARRGSWTWLRARRMRSASRPSTGRRTNASSASPRGRRRSSRSRSRHPGPRSRRLRRSTRSARAARGRCSLPRQRPVSRGRRRPHRPPRQNPDTATAWSATTSSAASNASFLCVAACQADAALL